MRAFRPSSISRDQRQWSRRLDGDPQAVVTARTLTAAVLLGWDADLVEDAVLVTSELVTNALAHGATPVTLALAIRQGPEPTIPESANRPALLLNIAVIVQIHTWTVPDRGPGQGTYIVTTDRYRRITHGSTLGGEK